jgi:type IV pilus assembly protein PilW
VNASAGARTTPARVHGVSLVDALVGLAIAMVALVVAHRTFLAFDTVRRNASAAADAQSSGAFALFAIASHVANAGAGITAASAWLGTCPAGADAASTLRPLAVLITDSGRADRPDTLVVRQGLAPMIAVPAAFASAAAAGESFRVQSADTFRVGDRVIAVSRTGACAMAQVTGVGAPAAGVVDLAHSAVAIDLPATSVLLNAGPAAQAMATRYDVASETLRTTDVTNGDAPVPLTSNVVNLKFQYGIDSDGDGALDTWVSAAAAGEWSPAALLAAPPATLARIRAVRAGIVVRSERPDRALARDYRWVLFDCEAADKAACPGRLEGTIAATANGAYRYRTYEIVVPLRNVMWNRPA